MYLGLFDLVSRAFLAVFTLKPRTASPFQLSNNLVGCHIPRSKANLIAVKKQNTQYLISLIHQAETNNVNIS